MRWEIENVADRAPAAIFTDARTVSAFVFELLKVTVLPIEGAVPFSVTVPDTVSSDPPITEDAVIPTLRTEGGFSVSVADFTVEGP
jgi:hypothetical protein